MVYFPDWDFYDIIPEYRLPESMGISRPGQDLIWPTRYTTYCGAVVQAFPVEPSLSTAEGEWRGVEAGRMGVKIVTVVNNGEANWWTVKRHEDEQVGTDSIVL